MIFLNLNIFVDKIEFFVFKNESHNNSCILKNKIIMPKSFDIGNKLNYIRKYIESIINIYNVEFGYINIDKFTLENNFINILKVEGIIEELFLNCGVKICR